MKPIDTKNSMKFRVRTICQNCFLGLVILIGCSFVYHEIASNLQEAWAEKEQSAPNRLKNVNPRPPGWLERAPRSLNRDYDMIENEVHPNSVYDILRRSNDEHSVTPSPALSLDDIFISVKTTKRFHKTRLDTIIKTWFNLAKRQTWFFTDTNDKEYQQKTGGHLINTNCSSSHNRKALCCKMAREFDGFLESQKKWWCHFDDDNYVNIPSLVKTLEVYDPLLDWYVGKPSIKAPLEILNKDNISQKISFWFATGGAGFCVSKSLALKMLPIAGGGRFISVGEKIRLPDDVTMGYIIEHVLQKKLTVVNEFHSHLEPMRFISPGSLSDQITFSYSQYATEMNVLPIPGLSKTTDPTRLLSLHCILFQTEDYCNR